MAILARDSLTLAQVTEVAYARRYYKLNPSTASAPAAPTTVPPTGASGWVTTEPAYTPASTDSLYVVDVTVLTDGMFDYTPVSKSSSYEAARQAYNKALAAQEVAETGTIALPRLVVGNATINTATAQAISANVGQFLSLNASQLTAGTISTDRFAANTITSVHMVAGTITAASGIIADAAITNAKIANVDAGKINTGFLNSAVIAAGSLTADKVLIGSGQNILIDPEFRIPNAWTTPAWVQTTGARLGNGPSALIPASSTTTTLYTGAQPEYTIPVHEGENYSVSIYFSTTLALTTQTQAQGRLSLVVRFRNASGTWSSPTTIQQNSWPVAANTWSRMFGSALVPAGMTHMAIGVTKNSTHNAAVRLSDPTVRVAANGELIVDGSIDGRIITGAIIQTSAELFRGIKFDSTGIKAYDFNGLNTFMVDSNGNTTLRGTVVAGTDTSVIRMYTYQNQGVLEFNTGAFNDQAAIMYTSKNASTGIWGTYYNTGNHYITGVKSTRVMAFDQTITGSTTRHVESILNLDAGISSSTSGFELRSSERQGAQGSSTWGSALVKGNPTNGYLQLQGSTRGFSNGNPTLTLAGDSIYFGTTDSTLTDAPSSGGSPFYSNMRFNVVRRGFERRAASSGAPWIPETTDWQNLSLLTSNGWQPASAMWSVPQWRLINGVCFLRGRISGPGGTGTPPFYLPDEALPALGTGDVHTGITDGGGPQRFGVWGANNGAPFRAMFALLGSGQINNVTLSACVPWATY